LLSAYTKEDYCRFKHKCCFKLYSGKMQYDLLRIRSVHKIKLNLNEQFVKKIYI